MPELPEVETVVRSLRPRLTGQRIQSARISGQRMRRSGPTRWVKSIGGQMVREVRRRGKWIIIELDDGHLLVHLGMTGQLRVVPVKEPVAPHTHVTLRLGRKHELRFRDERRFGSVAHFANAAALQAFLDDKLGPEPFELEPTAWRNALQRTRRAIKAVLLDQAVVAGVGNIYADESLHRARIHPATPAQNLAPRMMNALRLALSEVLTVAIECRGSSIRNYLDGNGACGGYQEEFRVYQRYGEPCGRCGAMIERIRLAGRSTHFCPCCQRMPASRHRLVTNPARQR